jgi:phage shock protein PspC (stress-responsive transcriptional regulator)
MKKTIDINLGGLLFHLDEDAYAVLSGYLEALRRHLAATEGREEVLADIEARIAEIFTQRMAGTRQVVSTDDVQAAMNTLGQPKDFAEGDSAQGDSAADFADEPRRRLFRDSEEKVIGGVCSGIANYFDIDVVIVRILFAVVGIFTGFGVLLYFIMWAVTPKAMTAADRLAMKGKPATFDNIRQTVEEEFKNVEARLKDKENHRKVRKAAQGIGDIITCILVGFGRFLGGLFLVIAFFFGSTILIAVFGNGITIDGAHLSVSELMGIFLPAGFGLAYFWTATALVLAGPLVAMVMLALRLLFRQKGPVHRAIMGTALMLSIIGIALMGVLGARFGSEFREEATVVHVESLPQEVKQWTMVMSTTRVEGGTKLRFNDDDTDESSWILTDSEVYFDGIDVDVRPTYRDRPSLEWTAEAQGGSRRAARERAAAVTYDVRTDSTGRILVGDLLHYPKTDRFRGQNVELVLYLPVGHSVFLDATTVPYLDDVANVENIWDGHMGGKTWLMTEQGLAEFK